jgi:hypothetical protein
MIKLLEKRLSQKAKDTGYADRARIDAREAAPSVVPMAGA